MTNQQDFEAGCFAALVGGFVFWLISFGISMIFLTIKQTIGVSVLCGIIGFISSNWIFDQVDRYQRWNNNRKKK